MDDFKKISSNEWGAPNQGPGTGPLNGIEQFERVTDGVGAVLGKEEKRQIQGADINGYIKGSLNDDASATERGDEMAEEERVEKEARANQR